MEISETVSALWRKTVEVITLHYGIIDLAKYSTWAKLLWRLMKKFLGKPFEGKSHIQIDEGEGKVRRIYHFIPQIKLPKYWFVGSEEFILKDANYQECNQFWEHKSRWLYIICFSIFYHQIIIVITKRKIMGLNSPFLVINSKICPLFASNLIKSTSIFDNINSFRLFWKLWERF